MIREKRSRGGGPLNYRFDGIRRACIGCNSWTVLWLGLGLWGGLSQLDRSGCVKII